MSKILLTIAIPIYLCAVSVAVCTIVSDLSSCNRDHVACWPKILTIQPFTEEQTEILYTLNHIYPSPPPPGPGKCHPISVSVNLTILGTSDTWNHAVFVLLCWLFSLSRMSSIVIQVVTCARICFLFLKKMFGCAAQHVGSYLPDQESNPCLLHWKHGILTTGPAGKSPRISFLFKTE